MKCIREIQIFSTLTISIFLAASSAIAQATSQTTAIQQSSRAASQSSGKAAKKQAMRPRISSGVTASTDSSLAELQRQLAELNSQQEQRLRDIARMEAELNSDMAQEIAILRAQMAADDIQIAALKAQIELLSGFPGSGPVGLPGSKVPDGAGLPPVKKPGPPVD
jgi:hypothetical protein